MSASLASDPQTKQIISCSSTFSSRCSSSLKRAEELIDNPFNVSERGDYTYWEYTVLQLMSDTPLHQRHRWRFERTGIHWHTNQCSTCLSITVEKKGGGRGEREGEGRG